jgi:hypothetical protein
MSALDMFPEVHKPKVDENRRYTTRSFMSFIKRSADVDAWDLDPAADEESHHAPRWFAAPGDVAPNAAAVDGLEASWHPTPEWAARIDERRAACWRMTPMPANSYEYSRTWRVFINPPFDNIGPWLERVWQHLLYEDVGAARALGCDVFYRVAMVLPGNRTEQPFWQEHVEPYLAGHEFAGRFGYSLVAHSPPGRQSYGHPGNLEPRGGSAEWPSVVLVWRRA